MSVGKGLLEMAQAPKEFGNSWELPLVLGGTKSEPSPGGFAGYKRRGKASGKTE